MIGFPTQAAKHFQASPVFKDLGSPGYFSSDTKLLVQQVDTCDDLQDLDMFFTFKPDQKHSKGPISILSYFVFSNWI